MSSAVGPFAVDEGLVRADSDTATVRIFNTNTKKIIRATFPLEGGRARYDGDLVIPGVAGTGAPVRLDFVEPGGAATGKLFPSGNTMDRLEVPGFGSIDASLVDAANPAVFVRARDIGLTGTEFPSSSKPTRRSCGCSTTSGCRVRSGWASRRRQGGARRQRRTLHGDRQSAHGCAHAHRR